jgi:hypothetical protein
MNRWRGRLIGLAIVIIGVTGGAAIAALGGVWSPSSPASSTAAAQQLVVRGWDDEILLRLPLPAGHFALRYRNSLYGSLAEERFAVGADGMMELVGLAADDAAVLDEYYLTAGPQPAAAGDSRRWHAQPIARLRLERLTVAATEHGRRTLLVGDRQIPLWQLAAGGAPTVVLEVEPPR